MLHVRSPDGTRRIFLSDVWLARAVQACPASTNSTDYLCEATMTMQCLCHRHSLSVFVAASLWTAAALSDTPPPANDYPTQARVEYVNECIANHDDSLANVYQCSCTIDRIADRLSYDDFVEAITFARYSGLPGEGGALFRDPVEARKMARAYRELEAEAQRACGLK
jgi:hypothetical protein